MIELKKFSGKQCSMPGCESRETAQVRMKGDRGLSGILCVKHVWSFLKDAGNEKPDGENKPQH